MKKDSRTFEESMERLEQIVRSMEAGEVALDDSIKLFKEGMDLVKSCGKMLDKAQMQITKVTAAKDGSPEEECFQDEV